MGRRRSIGSMPTPMPRKMSTRPRRRRSRTFGDRSSLLLTAELKEAEECLEWEECPIWATLAVLLRHRAETLQDQRLMRSIKDIAVTADIHARTSYTAV